MDSTASRLVKCLAAGVLAGCASAPTEATEPTSDANATATASVAATSAAPTSTASVAATSEAPTSTFKPGGRRGSFKGDGIHSWLPTAKAEEKAESRPDMNCCKGRNECKGKGNCKVEGEHDCAGQNACKGHGGCRGADC